MSNNIVHKYPLCNFQVRGMLLHILSTLPPMRSGTLFTSPKLDAIDPGNINRYAVTFHKLGLGTFRSYYVLKNFATSASSQLFNPKSCAQVEPFESCRLLCRSRCYKNLRENFRFPIVAFVSQY